MGWDSNPRGGLPPAGFQDRCLQPLGHPSRATALSQAGRPAQGAAAGKRALGGEGEPSRGDQRRLDRPATGPPPRRSANRPRPRSVTIRDLFTLPAGMWPPNGHAVSRAVAATPPAGSEAPIAAAAPAGIVSELQRLPAAIDGRFGARWSGGQRGAGRPLRPRADGSLVNGAGPRCRRKGLCRRAGIAARNLARLNVSQ